MNTSVISKLIHGNACSDGPVSTLPGHRTKADENVCCDKHEDRQAVCRIQGETDSMGCEYFFVCRECDADFNAEMQELRNLEECCDWCKNVKTGLYDRRDYDEGMSGPVYRVCSDCIKKQSDRLREETEAYQNEFLDHGDCDDGDYEMDDEDDDTEDEPVVMEPPPSPKVAPPKVAVTYKKKKRIVID